MAIKCVVQQPRPDFACIALAKCGHGWPSSHMQTMAFAFMSFLLLFLRRWHLGARPGSSRSLQNIKARSGGAGKKASSPTAGIGSAMELLEVVGLAVVTAGTALGRVYLGYHTAGQVAAGAVLGTAAAALWFYATLLLARAGVLRRLEQALAPTGLRLCCAWWLC